MTVTTQLTSLVETQLKNLVEKATGVHVHRVWPFGIDVCRDIKNALPAFQADVVFDVGANVGQSAAKFLRCFPQSHIYCFEPAGQTFRQLRENFKGNERVHSFQVALGASKGKGRLLLQGSPDVFRLLDPSEGASVSDALGVEGVDVEPLDEFCRDANINQISYLKIDTEGGDLAVLKGAENMLSEHRIELVEVEAGMHSGNERHVPFEVLKEFLESKRYLLFGIYGQELEWPTNEPYLRRTNPVFVSERTIRANAR
jgi:FkbM family methyltransferase